MQSVGYGEIYNIDTVNHAVDLDCEGVILTFGAALCDSPRCYRSLLQQIMEFILMK